MQHFFILNESFDKSVAGDVNLFSTAERLIIAVEAIDVRNDEYSCFTSEGCQVTLSAENDYGPVSATVETQPRHMNEAASILRSYLCWLASNGKIDADLASIERGSLVELVGLVPRSFVDG
ncbi:hypothetical protein [Taklimakanibacter albus]|uniref:Uncharacterized protein n=1 Tax=Taklimakanibacter albus TaxID=2800327 RepID=A0ACC5RC38_9HYPH|nr:hypothetical protein [Aestuariivirga sp. YIM B02566]MBK1869948.1 hypothetical protein [Aestuariivirga sp. YIM B02566]